MSCKVFVLGKKQGVFNLCGQSFAAVKLYVATDVAEVGTHVDDFTGLSVTEVFVSLNLSSIIHPFAFYELSGLDGFVYKEVSFCDYYALKKPFKTFVICVHQNYPI